MLMRGNLYDSEAPRTGERFEDLADLAGARVERIVSSTSPDSSPYDQPHDEWVALLQGEATLEIAGERIELRPGDWVLLPAQTVHRVLATSNQATWLAVHAAITAA